MIKAKKTNGHGEVKEKSEDKHGGIKEKKYVYFQRRPCRVLRLMPRGKILIYISSISEIQVHWTEVTTVNLDVRPTVLRERRMGAKECMERLRAAGRIS